MDLIGFFAEVGASLNRELVAYTPISAELRMSTFDCGVTQRLLATDKAHGKQSEWREPYPNIPTA